MCGRCEDVEEVRRRCGRVWWCGRCGGGVVEVWWRCGGGVVEVWWRCGGGVEGCGGK